MTVTCIGFVIWWKMLFAPETLARHCYSICKNYNIFSGCCANSLHCYLVYCFDLILCRHYLKDKLRTMDDDKFSLISTVQMKDPNTVLLVSIFLGVLGSTGL